LIAAVEVEPIKATELNWSI